MEALAKAGAFVLNALGVGLWVIIGFVLFLIVALLIGWISLEIKSLIDHFKAKKTKKKIQAQANKDNVIDITHADKKWDK